MYLNSNIVIKALSLFFFSVIITSGCDDTGKKNFIPIIGGIGLEAGNKISFDINSANCMMIYVPAKRFKDGLDDHDIVTVNRDFWIGETEVTYAVWYVVRSWASARTTNPYTFGSLGREGNDGGVGAVPATLEPVTTISWRSSMVWCNALTEWYNEIHGTKYSCVYKDGVVPIRDATNAAQCDAVIPDSHATGFRLLAADEWELAARYISDTNNDGDIYDPGEYYPGLYASGAIANVVNTEANKAVAWYDENSGSATHNVKGLAPNVLGIYDMNGNVSEFCFDLSLGGSQRCSRGGSWDSTYQSIELGRDAYSNPDVTSNTIGLRLAKSAL